MGGRVNLTPRRIALTAGFAGTAVLLGVCWWAWWDRPPQMGSDKEVFKTVDALFTALTARDEKLLADCEQRLRALRDGGNLPEAAGTYLEGIIHTARASTWQTAAVRLYEFMPAQRRQGPPPLAAESVNGASRRERR